MKLPVLNIKCKSTGREVSLDKSIFGLEVHEHAIYLAIKHFRANNRQGTSKAKERGEITGSTRKIKKQKGTGTARAGSIKNPLFKGGGRIVGAKPRSYETKLNKKVKNLAQFSALSGKAKEKSIVVVEDFDFNEPKTKNYTNFLLNLGLSEEKTMLVLSDRKENISLSSRNLPKTNVVVTNELNTYDILNSSKLIFVESALKNIKK